MGEVNQGSPLSLSLCDLWETSSPFVPTPGSEHDPVELERGTWRLSVPAHTTLEKVTEEGEWTKGLSLSQRSQSPSGPSLPYHFLAPSSMESPDPFSPFIVDIS